MATWRYLAYRATTKEPLHLDLPLEVEELGWALSGAGPLRATVSPDVGALRGSDGRLLLEEWGTLLFAEADGQIRWGGILIASGFNGEAWALEAAQVATYPNGMAYDGVYSKVGVDPAQVVKDIWAHLQSKPDGDLGVTVAGDSTPTRLGIPAVPARPEVYLGGKWVARSSVDASDIEPSTKADLAKGMTKTQTSLTLASAALFGQIATPFEVKVGSERITVGSRSGTSLWNLTRGVGTSTPSAHGKGTDVVYKGTPTRTVEAIPAEPYRLTWDEATDLGSEIETLRTEANFDFAEAHRWNGETIASSIEIGYPRLGTKRTDLAFIQGDNVIDLVTPTLNGDDFANVVIGVGAGEGTKSIHRTNAVRDGRLRRTAVYTSKATKTAARMDTLIAAEAARRRNLLEISEVTVTNHPNAVIGSWALGDDVLIEASLPWLGNVAVWCRIVAWSLLDDNTARLSLLRSDSFAYGG